MMETTEMTTTNNCDLRAQPPPLGLVSPIPLPDEGTRIEVRRVLLDTDAEDQLRLRACVQRLTVLRRRIEWIEN